MSHDTSLKTSLCDAMSAINGNPRNKCALQPGHSLMDWIRLGASGKDLTGVGSQAGRLSVTKSELAKHNKINDIWLAIRGRVYNVTAYIPFHPGGPDELMKAAGVDATKLFDQVHPWVNYEQILQKCFIGRLVSIDPGINSQDLFFGKQATKKSFPNNFGESKTPTVEAVPKKTGAETPKKQQSVAKVDLSNAEDELEEQTDVVSLPRFDWIQQLNSITVIFYTPAFSNPMVEVIPPDANKAIMIVISNDETIFRNEIVFYENVVWPCFIRVTCETGKVEVIFTKCEDAIWSNYGVLRQQSESVEAVTGARYNHVFSDRITVNHNIYLIKLNRTDGRKIVVPIGKHVRAFANIDGQEWSRSYTPVPSSLFTNLSLNNYTSDTVCLMIKRYKNGNVSRFLTDREENDVVYLTGPLGDFDLRTIEKKETFLLLAAGTGITPMFSLLVFLLERRIRKCQFVRLLFFNKTQQDIPFKDQLDNLQSTDSRFKIDYILSTPDKNWLGLQGHINKDMIENSILEHIMDTGYTIKDIFTFVCGPNQFLTIALEELEKIGIIGEQIYVFQG
ncbi:cytochrome b5 reductase 4 isoform X3 [Leptinotarsa decemlineata]|uniref:cytochrome b5 reductase 4 isoform X3 n=1 Tax=Leptinotarsa decemlineata TaxID=7539 RepID=UPI003D30BDF0